MDDIRTLMKEVDLRIKETKQQTYEFKRDVILGEADSSRCNKVCWPSQGSDVCDWQPCNQAWEQQRQWQSPVLHAACQTRSTCQTHGPVRWWHPSLHALQSLCSTILAVNLSRHWVPRSQQGKQVPAQLQLSSAAAQLQYPLHHVWLQLTLWCSLCCPEGAEDPHTGKTKADKVLRWGGPWAC